MKTVIQVIFLGLILTACGADDRERERAEKGKLEQAMDSQKQALEKARQVEEDIMKAAEQQKKEIDEQSQ